uniref:Nucleotide-diphospho-sugar transferase domain-containing protein n=1 Tax=Ostreococcus mediterraneus TaxID=1486918 RepID=A0A7S0KII5_9CHLO|mmetsp:Transcript_4102/g.14977  ORF Transcript_4102/g.14977 Transcript_4102/m.14977 type:complete len:553 (+) Transcript_4102:266-1924(+)
MLSFCRRRRSHKTSLRCVKLWFCAAFWVCTCCYYKYGHFLVRFSSGLRSNGVFVSGLNCVPSTFPRAAGQTATAAFQLDPSEAKAIENLQPGSAWREHAFFKFLVRQTLQYKAFKCESIRQVVNVNSPPLRRRRANKEVADIETHRDEFKYVHHILLKQLPSYDSVQDTLYPAERGIVFTLPQTATATTCVKRTLKLLRKTDVTLPVEIWTFDGHAANDVDNRYDFCQGKNDNNDAHHKQRDGNQQQVVTCRDMREHVSSLGLGSKLLPATRFEYCVYAIYFSGFQEVLFLDYDAAPLRGVSHLFHSSRFQQSGQLYYSDLWGSNTTGWGQTAHETSEVWSLTRVKHYATREVESGIVLLNKRKRWRELNVALHLARHTDVMQPRQQQKQLRQQTIAPIIYGDKDIWRLAHYMLRSDFIMGTAVLLASRPRDVARRLAFGANATCAVGTIGHIDAENSSRVLFAHQPKTLEVPFVSKAHIAVVDLKCDDEEVYPGPVIFDCRRCWQRKTGEYDYATGMLRGVHAEWVKHECVSGCTMDEDGFATYASNASFI